MRILVVNNFYPPRVGGSAHLADALARGYARAGHDVLVVTAAYQGAPAEEQPEPRLRVVRLPSASVPETRLSVSFDLAFTLRPSLRRRLRTLLDDFAPDVIHQHGQFFDLTWATAMYARRRGVPALLSVHTRLENPKAAYHGIFRWLDAVVVAPILRLYKPRIVVMDVQMDDYIKRRYRGAYAGLDYIPVGVDPNRMAGGNGDTVRDRHGLGDAPLIVTLGHVIPLRDRVWLVEALPAVLAELPDTRLVVVGHVYYDLFLQRARELGVEHAVLSIGAVAKSEVPDYLAAADVECHDLQGYGMGTATLESMAAGVPVVVAVRPDNFPGIDLISGENCVLVPLGDIGAIAESITKLLRDPADRARIGEAGRQLVRRHFAMDVVLDQHLAVLGALRGTEG
ncbi:MAG TPA: glycosyltransferase family 4 protein [Jatrophihabitans sp.]|jgi:glycosyltransferase involved in cell wall biosynthesis